MFKILKSFNRARTGVFSVNNKSIKTPFFMPVATKAVGKFIGVSDYNKIGVKAFISNSLILYLRNGLDFFNKINGIHELTDYKGIIFTDSGGFQMIREGFFLKRSKRAVHFRDPVTSQKHVMTPKKVMDIALSIKPDVAMVLDDLAPANASYDEVLVSMKHTHKWAVEALEYHNKLDPEHKQAVFGIIQGGFFEDLRKSSAKFIGSLNFDGVAIGGVAVGESRKDMLKAVSLSVDVLDSLKNNKLRYVMGVGNPADIVNLVDRGIDCFDSIYPTQNARHGTLFTFKGRLDVMKSKYKFVKDPVEHGCDCELCKNHSVAYLRYLLKKNDPEGKRLASVHNLRFMQRLMEKIQESIINNDWPKFKKKINLLYESKNEFAGSSACTLRGV